MRKHLSIILLFVFLFNVGGYHVLLLVLHYSAFKELTGNIDQENHLPEDSNEIKVYLNLPYPIHETQVKTYSEFEYDGEHYVLAEQRLDNDTLYIKTVRNNKRKQIDNAFKEYAENSNDLPSSKQKGNNLLGKLMKEYKNGKTAGIVEWQNGFSQRFDFSLLSDELDYEKHTGDTFRPPKHHSQIS